MQSRRLGTIAPRIPQLPLPPLHRAAAPLEEVLREIDLVKHRIADLESAIVELPTAMGVVDYEQPHDLPVHIRGSHLTLGAVAKRAVPAVLDDAERFPGPQLPADHSGRLELARWLVDPRHPLTARVLVNRLWRWHFGRGLVESTDNFGRLGEPPWHPELLDWLAGELIRSGWSIKHMHRLIMTSAVYQRASAPDPHNAALDPDNLFLWRANVRRLEAEAIRDALLASGGILNLKMGGSLLHRRRTASSCSTIRPRTKPATINPCALFIFRSFATTCTRCFSCSTTPTPA